MRRSFNLISKNVNFNNLRQEIKQAHIVREIVYVGFNQKYFDFYIKNSSPFNTKKIDDIVDSLEKNGKYNEYTRKITCDSGKFGLTFNEDSFELSRYDKTNNKAEVYEFIVGNTSVSSGII